MENERKRRRTSGRRTAIAERSRLHSGINPKTIYNKLWKGEFPLVPVRVPWNRKGLFFRRKEVIEMAHSYAYPGTGALARLLASVPESLRPISVAVHGPLPHSIGTARYPQLNIQALASNTLPDWRSRYDLLRIANENNLAHERMMASLRTMGVKIGFWAFASGAAVSVLWNAVIVPLLSR
jgi:hypothetical protein